jgi:hypothetical protein
VSAEVKMNGTQAKYGTFSTSSFWNLAAVLSSFSLRSHLLTTRISAARLPRERGDLEVLVLDAERRVDEEDADVGAVDRAAGAERRVELDALVDLALAAQPGVSTKMRSRPWY